MSVNNATTADTDQGDPEIPLRDDIRLLGRILGGTRCAIRKATTLST